MEEIYQDIPSANQWTIIREIKEGWSDDLKFYIQNDIGMSFLLRISDGLSLERERTYYDALRKLNAPDLLTSKLLLSGLCNNGKNTFRLFSWIDGVEVIKVLDSLTQKEQYDYGFESGSILRNIHQINSPSKRQDWAEYFNLKIDKKIVNYRNCGITIKHSDKILAYIDTHRHLLADRPQSFHHGDFHLGNMLLTPQKKLAVIDFNRLDFGDPWEEFNRISWTATKSSWFASGQINGYFNDRIPENFFKLMALYIGVNQLGSIPWAIPYGKKEIKVILDQVEEVMEWYDNFNRIIPKWYR